MTLEFVTPPGVRFTCTQCGDCCRTWNVPLQPAERERIQRLDWTGREPDLVDASVSVSTQGPGGAPAIRLHRRDDGSCVFLGARNQCRIHEHFGADAKPLACRLYPFGFKAIGSRVAVDVAFSCRAVSEGRGAPVAPDELEWTRLANEARASEDRGEHRLSGDWSVPGDTLWEIESRLVDLISDASLRFSDRVRCAVQFLALATTGDPTRPTARQLRDAIAAGLPRRIRTEPLPGPMDPAQRVLFYQWLYLALNPTPGDLHERPERERAQLERGRVRSGERFRDAVGRPTVDGRELGVTFDDVRRVDPGPLREHAFGVAETYFRAKLVGHRFLVAPQGDLPFVEAGHALFLWWPMAAWTAKALAAERGAGVVEEADVRRALRLLDRSLGQLTFSMLPRKQAEACLFLLTQHDLVEHAIAEMEA
jgi:lysine-N-methylase